MATDNIVFKAQVTYLSINEGGLKTPISSGFRTKIKFEYDEQLVVGEQELFDEELVYPGDTATVQITTHLNERLKVELSTGTTFDLILNEKIIGSGVIKEIIA
jgi:translation elongation factor EF-Tu-like GTPase